MRTNIDHNTTATLVGEEKQKRFAIPWDIRVWVDAPLLSQWVAAELQGFDWEHPALTAYLQKHPQYRPRELLAICVFSYAIGLLESEEIAYQSFRDPLLREVAGHTPTAKDLARFRKENRGLIRHVLTQVLKRAVRQRYDLGDFVPAGLRKLLEQNTAERLDFARHMDRAAQGA